MLGRNKFLYSFSRPALRTAASGGRPRPAARLTKQDQAAPDSSLRKLADLHTTVVTSTSRS